MLKMIVVSLALTGLSAFPAPWDAGAEGVGLAERDVLVASVPQAESPVREKVTFDDKTAEGECFVDMDADLIREAITNIMSNAMRYTPEGGWVVVSVERDRPRGEARVSVQDTGIGIAREDIPRVFSRFWRSDASRERVSGGLGVGLALTKEIVDKHKGTISVESELDKGTTFTTHVPLERKDRPHKAPATDDRQGPQITHRP